MSITSSTIATRTTTGSSSNFNSEENPGSISTTWSQIIFQFLRCEGFALLGIIIFSILFIHFDSDIPKLLVLPFLLYFMVEVLVWWVGYGYGQCIMWICGIIYIVTAYINTTYNASYTFNHFGMLKLVLSFLLYVVLLHLHATWLLVSERCRT